MLEVKGLKYYIIKYRPFYISFVLFNTFPSRSEYSENKSIQPTYPNLNRPRSSVGNVSGNRFNLTADPGVTSSLLARSHTLLEIDHEIISTVILLFSAESFKKGCCLLQAKVCARSTG